jgi:hypothetical protein
MTDITSVLNEALKKHNVSLRKLTRVDLHNVDEFLKEAYRIVRFLFPLSIPSLTAPCRTRIFQHFIPTSDQSVKLTCLH